MPALDPMTEKEYVPGPRGAGKVRVTPADPGARTEMGLAAQVAPPGNPAQVMLTGLFQPAMESILAV
jgi:hypothetical protein